MVRSAAPLVARLEVPLEDQSVVLSAAPLVVRLAVPLVDRSAAQLVDQSVVP